MREVGRLGVKEEGINKYKLAVIKKSQGCKVQCRE